VYIQLKELHHAIESPVPAVNANSNFLVPGKNPGGGRGGKNKLAKAAKNEALIRKDGYERITKRPSSWCLEDRLRSKQFQLPYSNTLDRENRDIMLESKLSPQDPSRHL